MKYKTCSRSRKCWHDYFNKWINTCRKFRKCL